VAQRAGRRTRGSGVPSEEVTGPPTASRHDRSALGCAGEERRADRVRSGRRGGSLMPARRRLHFRLPRVVWSKASWQFVVYLAARYPGAVGPEIHFTPCTAPAPRVHALAAPFVATTAMAVTSTIHRKLDAELTCPPCCGAREFRSEHARCGRGGGARDASRKRRLPAGPGSVPWHSGSWSSDTARLKTHELCAAADRRLV
jgi:hypothetical protein